MMRAGLAALAAGLVFGCAANAATIYETADPALTTAVVDSSLPFPSVTETFTVPTPVILDATDSELIVTALLANPVTVPTYNLQFEPFTFTGRTASFVEGFFPIFTETGPSQVTFDGLRAYFMLEVYNPHDYAPVPVGGSYTVTFSDAPEPGVWALMLAGFAFLGGAVRVGKRHVEPQSTRSPSK